MRSRAAYKEGVKGSLMTRLFVMEADDGRKFVWWAPRIESEGTIGDAVMELPKGAPFEGVPWDELTQGMVIEVPDEEA